jgi:hypothetical protein
MPHDDLGMLQKVFGPSFLQKKRKKDIELVAPADERKEKPTLKSIMGGWKQVLNAKNQIPK